MNYAKWASLALISAACLFVVFFAEGASVSPKDAPVASQNRTLKDADELSSIWNEQAARYVKISLPAADLKAPFAAALIGIGVIMGADMLVRRKADNVIKRFISKNKDNG
jgi:hypothetical protein